MDVPVGWVVKPDVYKARTLDKIPPVAVAQYTLYRIADVKPDTETSAFAPALAVTAGGAAAAVEPPLPVPAFTSAALGGDAPWATTTHRTLSLVSDTVRTVTVVAAVLTALGCDENAASALVDRRRRIAIGINIINLANRDF